MPPSSWNCPKPAAQYESEHTITEVEFYARNPQYLTRHNAGYVAEKVDPLTNCEIPVGVDPTGNMVLGVMPGLVYYPAGLFKALLASGTETFEMFATQETEPPYRQDVIVKANPKQGKSSYYDMSDDEGILY